jgi:YVTN family beta-propeller protein
MVYVTNFDDSTVSVIDAATRAVVRTVPVDDGPIGIAASADGTRVYIACFRAGTLSVLRTGDDRVIANIQVGNSPNGVAVTPDGAYVVVTDTAADRIVIVAADTLNVLSDVIGGEQPSGITLDGQGRLAFASNFSGGTVTVVDLDARRRRAIIRVPFTTASSGLLGIAVAPATGQGYIAAFYQSSARSLRADLLRAFQPEVFPFANGARPEAIVTDHAGTFAYFTGHDADTGTGRLSVISMANNEVQATILVGRVPEALALAPDETLAYVANTGNNNVSVVDTASRRAVGTIRVGQAPMGIVAVAFPEVLFIVTGNSAYSNIATVKTPK